MKHLTLNFRKICFIAILSILSANFFISPLFAQTIIPAGNLTHWHWTAEGSPYIIRGNLVVPIETFNDYSNDGIWDQFDEPFSDLDGDGRKDSNEPYTDTNGNGRWDTAEPLTFA